MDQQNNSEIQAFNSETVTKVNHFDNPDILAGFRTSERARSFFLNRISYPGCQDFADFLIARIPPSIAPLPRFAQLRLKIKQTTPLEINQSVSNPFLCFHVVDLRTGLRLPVRTCPQHPPQETKARYSSLSEWRLKSLRFVTQEFDLVDTRSTCAVWNEDFTLTLPQGLSYDPNTLVLFEVQNFMRPVSQMGSVAPPVELYRLCWGYLRPFGFRGPHAGPLDVQLFRYKFSESIDTDSIVPDVPPVFFDFLWLQKAKYNKGSLRVEAALDEASDRPASLQMLSKGSESSNSLPDGKESGSQGLNSQRQRNRESLMREEYLCKIRYKEEEGSHLPSVPYHKLPTSGRGVSALRFSNQGHLLAYAVQPHSNQSRVIVWDFERKAEHSQLQQHWAIIHEINWHSSDCFLLSCSSDNLAKVSKVSRKRSGLALPSVSSQSIDLVHPSFVYCARFFSLDKPTDESKLAETTRPKDFMVATGCRDRLFRVWHIEVKTKRSQLIASIDLMGSAASPEVFPNSFCVSGNGRFYVGDSQGTLHILSLGRAASANGLGFSSLGQIIDDEMRGDIINQVEVVDEGRHLLVQTRDNCIRLIEERSRNVIVRYFKGCFSECNIKFFVSRDQKYVLCGNENGQLRVWDLLSGEPLEHSIDYRISGPLYAADWNPHYNAIALAGYGVNFPVLVFVAE